MLRRPCPGMWLRHLGGVALSRWAACGATPPSEVTEGSHAPTSRSDRTTTRGHRSSPRCHLGDAFGVLDGRLQLMLTFEDPTFPYWDQDQTAIDDEPWRRIRRSHGGARRGGGADRRPARPCARSAWARPGLGATAGAVHRRVTRPLRAARADPPPVDVTRRRTRRRGPALTRVSRTPSGDGVESLRRRGPAYRPARPRPSSGCLRRWCRRACRRPRSSRGGGRRRSAWPFALPTFEASSPAPTVGVPVALRAGHVPAHAPVHALVVPWSFSNM